MIETQTNQRKTEPKDKGEMNPRSYETKEVTSDWLKWLRLFI